MTFPILKKYRILRKICSKFAFTVYEAEGVVDRLKYFIKVLNENLAGNKTYISHFLNSARLTSLLNSKEICKIYTYDNENGLYYIVSEPVSFKSLSIYIHEEYPSSLQKVTTIVTQIASVLRNAHIKCVLHGLLNPSCIYLKGDKLKIDDFGFSWLIPRIRLEDAEAMYLSYYVAPEVYFNDQVMDGRADIYSLGAIFLQLLTEDFTFNGKVDTEIKNKYLLSSIPVVKKLFPENADLLEQIFHKSLNHEPNNRYLNFKQFIADMEKLYPEVPISVSDRV